MNKNSLIELVKAKPLHAAGAGVVALFVVAVLAGLVAGDKPEAAPAAIATQTPPATAATAQTPQQTAPVASNAIAAAHLRPAALPLSATVHAGATEAAFSRSGGWVPLGAVAVEGSPTALVSTTDSRRRFRRGWNMDADARVERAGLMRVDVAGDYTFLLSIKDGVKTYRATCSVAVGDPGSVVAKREGRGEASGVSALATGYHWIYSACEFPGEGEVSAEIYALELGELGASPAAIPLYLIAEPVAPVEPAEAAQVEPEPVEQTEPVEQVAEAVEPAEAMSGEIDDGN